MNFAAVDEELANVVFFFFRLSELVLLVLLEK